MTATNPSISDPLEQPNSISQCVTASLARRLLALAETVSPDQAWERQTIGHAGWRLSRCADAGKRQTGWRCGASYCPRCARQRARTYGKRLSVRLRERSVEPASRHGFALLTVTVAAYSPTDGYLALRRTWQRFARRKVVRAVLAGGEGHIQAEPARGAQGERWNVHLHAIVELAGPLGRRPGGSSTMLGAMSRRGSGFSGPSTSGADRTSPQTLSLRLETQGRDIQPRVTSVEGLSGPGFRTTTRSWRRGSHSSRVALDDWCLPGGRGGLSRVALLPARLRLPSQLGALNLQQFGRLS
jgi:hypothetical protein